MPVPTKTRKCCAIMPYAESRCCEAKAVNEQMMDIVNQSRWPEGTPFLANIPLCQEHLDELVECQE